MPDLLLTVTVEFWACAIHCSLPLHCTALYQISVRHNANFADGFLQISPHGEHPCHSLSLPINSVCAGTCTLQVKELCPTYQKECPYKLGTLFFFLSLISVVIDFVNGNAHFNALQVDSARLLSLQFDCFHQCFSSLFVFSGHFHDKTRY